MTADDNFLARWARRKAEVAKASEAKPVEQAADPRPDDHVEQEPFDLASLPSLDQLTAETDIRPFMHKLVPQDLRNAALRRVWELDASIRDYVSPATEYAWDFNVEGGAPGYGALEAGFDAAKAAVNMFSSRIEDHTLVERSSTEMPEIPLAVAKGSGDISPSAGSGSDLLPTERLPAVQDKTVRVSTETVAISTIKGNPEMGLAAPATAEASRDDLPKITAAPKSARRHGGAAPR